LQLCHEVGTQYIGWEAIIQIQSSHANRRDALTCQLTVLRAVSIKNTNFGKHIQNVQPLPRPDKDVRYASSVRKRLLVLVFDTSSYHIIRNKILIFHWANLLSTKVHSCVVHRRLAKRHRVAIAVVTGASI
jgi:hypothetical protein